MTGGAEMLPMDAIAQPFIERDYRTPFYDKAIADSRKYHKMQKNANKIENRRKRLQTEGEK
jgi:hypothetical protein